MGKPQNYNKLGILVSDALQSFKGIVIVINQACIIHMINVDFANVIDCYRCNIDSPAPKLPETRADRIV